MNEWINPMWSFHSSLLCTATLLITTPLVVNRIYGNLDTTFEKEKNLGLHSSVPVKEIWWLKKFAIFPIKKNKK